MEKIVGKYYVLEGHRVEFERRIAITALKYNDLRITFNMADATDATESVRDAVSVAVKNFLFRLALIGPTISKADMEYLKSTYITLDDETLTSQFILKSDSDDQHFAVYSLRF